MDTARYNSTRDPRSGDVLLPPVKVESFETEDEETGTFRTNLPQVLATMAQSMLLFALGMIVSAPTIVIPAVTNKNLTNCGNITADGEACLGLTSGEASTFAGLLLIMQPLGSLTAGVVQEPIGRKLCMLLVNLPELAGWLLLYHATTKWHLFVAAICMGFTVGFMEAPTFSYVGEIAQPHLRGVLASSTSVFISVGTLLMYLLGTFLHWRTAIAISVCVPFLTTIAILQIPESPVWLLAKGREKAALRALCWLRGWTTPDRVEKEFLCLKEHTAISKMETSGLPEKCPNGGAPGRPTLMEKLKDLSRPAMIRPLTLVVVFFAFAQCAALNGARPYLVSIYTRLSVKVNPFLGTVFGAISQILGGFSCMAVVHKVGKRTLAIVTMAACSVILLCLGTYSLLMETGYLYISWLPLVLMSMLSFSSYAGIITIPWALLSEVFPQRGRGVGGGLTAAFYYLMWFTVTKTWPHLQSVIELYGMFFFYSGLGFIGCLYLYVWLPETEGKSLQEIETMFKKKRLRS